MRNIKLKHYALLPDVSKYEILESLKPLSTIKASGIVKSMNINKMPYANVKYAIKLFPKSGTWDVLQHLFEICFDVTEAEFWELGIKEFVQAKRYMVQEFDRVIKTEATALASQSTDQHLWDMAGADKLKPYSDTLPLVQLGKMFGQYPFDLGRKPYSEVFSLLVQTKTQNEVESEYQKLKIKK